MRPLMLIIGFLLVIYVIAEWINGTLRYSFEGYIGSGVYGITDYFSPNFMPYAVFMGIVYVLTFLLGIAMIWIGATGERK